jgi:hypothetical protein
MKQITVNGRNYVIHKNPTRGWDLRLGNLLVLGFTIKEIRQIILNEDDKATG